MSLTTYTGRDVDPLNLKPTDVDIRDIAHALSRLCRFGGHVKGFYSVAQHCVYVADTLETHAESPEVILSGLLHDASEAYIVDIPRPIKHDPSFAPYRELEARVEETIAKAFLLPTPRPPQIKPADNFVLQVEQLVFMGYDDGWCPTVAEERFLERFDGLWGAFCPFDSLWPANPAAEASVWLLEPRQEVPWALHPTEAYQGA